jgi:hypothetical protein
VSWFTDNKFWAVVGKVAAVITICAGGVGIYLGIWPSKPKLIGYGSYFIYLLPPDLNRVLTNISNSQSGTYTPGIQNALTEFKNSIEQVIDVSTVSKQGDDIAKLRTNFIDGATNLFVKSILYDMFPPDFNKLVNSYSGFLHFYIRNNGDVVAKEVTLTTPFDGIAYIVPDSGARRVVEVKRSIEIGSIRQQQFVRVLIWSTEAPNLKDEGFFRLTHSSVIGEIEFSVSEFGLHYRILRDYLYFVVPGLLLLLGALLIAILIILDLLVGTSFVFTPARK